MEKYLNYSIGLDLGTNSVGWAVVGADYKVIRRKAKHLWGVRLFADAQTAQKRRLARSSRRRYERRKERIRLLQMLFGNTVREKDDSFFAKLDNSSMHSIEQDSLLGRKNHFNLFEGEYTDKNYYDDFATIYHLRKKLSESNEQADPRLVYLAMHHIVKYRGNFLYDGDLDNFSGSIEESIDELFSMLCDDGYAKLEDLAGKAGEVAGVLLNKEYPVYIGKYMKSKLSEEDLLRIKTKEEIICSLFPKEAFGFASQFTKAVLGYKFVLQKLFAEEIEEDEEKISVNFSDKFEEKRDEILQSAGDKENYIIKLESLYNALLFNDIMDGETKVCEAMINRYNRHKDHLKILKRVLKAVGKSAYEDMFNAEHRPNYASYVKSTAWGGSTGEGKDSFTKSGKCNQDEFYKAVKKALEKVGDDNKDKAYVLTEIEKGSFMPRLNATANGAIPYQFNLRELKAIIENQRKFYPELDANADKILSVMSFRRPYYVGVLNKSSDFSWAQERVIERVYPWNFYDTVNTDAMAEGFIKNMTNKCRYFTSESVLPMNSIRYQSFVVLNELNRIKIKDKYIAKQQKIDVFTELFCKKKTVSKKDVCKYFFDKYGTKITPQDIDGTADEKKFLGSMTSLADFKRILGEAFSPVELERYEAAINVMTVFDDFEMRKRRLRHECGFDGRVLDSLAKISYKYWGAYSKRLLDGVMNDSERTILRELYDGEDDKYLCPHVNWLLMDKRGGFVDKLPTDIGSIDKLIYEKHLKDMHCAPSVKRQVWQAIKVTEEIVAVMGCNPQSIFIESTREDSVKKATTARVSALSDAFDKIKKEIRENPSSDFTEFYREDAFNKLEACKEENNKLDQDKLFLYLSQMGRCMYSGEPIELNELDKCEIDHIIPRSYLKDDSLSNRVLVFRDINQAKSNTLAISEEVRRSRYAFWNFLLHNRLIGKKKYNNLMKDKYEACDLQGFINRQLVETSQTVKAVSELLSRRFECTVKGIKAGLSSELRYSLAKEGEEDFYKLRNLNDTHHAKDAYLAAVLGRFTTYEYPCWGKDDAVVALNRSIERLGRDLSGICDDERKKLTYKYVNERNSIIVDMLEHATFDDFVDINTGEIIDFNFSNLLTTMARADCIITKKIEYKGNSEFYNETIYPKGFMKGLIPLGVKKDSKGNPVALDTTLYGGYSSEKPEYMLLIKYAKGKNRKQETALINVPVLIAYRERQAPGALSDYVKSQGYENAIIIRKVYKGQLVNAEGQYVRIVSASELNNATQLIMPAKYNKLLWYVEKADSRKDDRIKAVDFYERLVESDLQNKDDEKDVFSDEKNIESFFEDYIRKLRKYYPLYSALADKLEKLITADTNAEISFGKLTKAQKLDLIRNLLTVTKASAAVADKMPPEYGCGPSVGRLRIKLRPDKVDWIFESPGGIYSVVKRSEV